MTINSETRVAGPFEGNDSTVDFPFTFKVFDSDELFVVRATNSVETVLTLGADYTVTLNPDQNAAPGGTVALLAPLATGSLLTLTSALEALQPLDLTNQGGFYPRVINNAFDRVTILIQQLKAVVSRTLKFPLSDGPVGDLPGRGARAGSVLAFDEATGEPVVGPSIADVGTVSGAVQAVVAVANSIADVNTTAGNIASVNTVAGSIADVNTVAGSIVDVNAVAGNMVDVNTVADNLADVSNFADVYYGPRATDPTTRKDGTPLQSGDLYFSTSTNALRAYNGTAWREAASGSVTVQNFSGDGVATQFQLNYAPESEVVTSVYIGGVYQQKNVYELGGVGGDVLIFDAPPPAGTNNIEVVVHSIVPSDDKLRQDLAAPAGASKIGYGGRTLDQWLDVNRSVLDFGAVADGITDDSAAASAMLAELNRLVIPSGRTVVLKNIELQAGASVEIRGCAKLPSACVDFDRMFYATGKGGITIDAKELDGNAAGQSGFIGTHLLYMLDCNDLQVNVRHIHDHYAPGGGAFATADGVRDSSTGCVLIYRSTRAVVSVGLLDKWGREGIQLRECVRSTVSLGHAQGYDGGDEYSGLQVSGENNSVLRASVDNAGASGVGFDTKNGSLANIISTRSRENHGVNFGHTGFPATGSVATNLLVDGAFRNGISVGASTEDLTIDGFSVRNAGEYGINYSDSAARGKLANGVVDTCGQFNLSAYQTQVEARNVRYAALDALSVRVDAVTGTFATGETVSSSGASAVVRKVLKNRAGDKQILFLNSVSGTFVANNTISGGTSLASGTIGLVSTPAAKRESTGGLFIEEALMSSGGLGTVTKLSDGTMIHRHSVAVAATASTLATLETNYPSTAAWVEAPHVTATVVAANSTDAFNLERLSCARTATAFTVKLKASAAQTYSVDVISIGRWK